MLTSHLPAPSPTAVAPNKAALVAADQKRIDAALAAPDATGMKGFLIWVEAAWPKPIADKILAAAKAHLEKSAARAAHSPISVAGNAAKAGTMGRLHAARRLGRFGQTSSLVSTSAVMQPINFTVGGSSSGSSTIAATPSSSAQGSWLSDIGTAITGAVQGYLGYQQSKDAQTLFNLNLQRAQQGLSPLNANPSAYGIVNPGINVGLSSSLQSMLLYGGIGLGAILLIFAGIHATKKK